MPLNYTVDERFGINEGLALCRRLWIAQIIDLTARKQAIGYEVRTVKITVTRMWEGCCSNLDFDFDKVFKYNGLH